MEEINFRNVSLGIKSGVNLGEPVLIADKTVYDSKGLGREIYSRIRDDIDFGPEYEIKIKIDIQEKCISEGDNQ